MLSILDLEFFCSRCNFKMFGELMSRFLRTSGIVAGEDTLCVRIMNFINRMAFYPADLKLHFL